MLVILFVLSLLTRDVHSAKYKFSSEQELTHFLQTEYERNQTAQCTLSNRAGHTYAVNVTDENEDILTKVTLKGGREDVYFYKTYFQGLDKDSFSTNWLRRQMKVLTKIGDAALPKPDYERLVRIINKMESIYAKAKICPFKKPNCNLETEGLSQEPEIENILAHSKDIDELAYVWRAWRDASGKQVKDLFREYVELKNKAAVLDGFPDAGASWRYTYDMSNMKVKIDKLWEQLAPLYGELHFYVLNKLVGEFGDKIKIVNGKIPAHITGNNYAQTWTYLSPLVTPFPHANKITVDEALKSKNYTAIDLFHIANEFYTSMGLADMTMSFRPNTMITRPRGREVMCHATAWDFCDGKDYRISMCTKIDQQSFNTIHHELGHIQYYIQYKNQSYIFRSSANPGFHEAIGDTIILSVRNPTHLKQIKLTSPNYITDYESTINFLMDAALEEIPNFAFTYLVDKWRWDVFRGRVKPQDWNQLWWEYRENVQRVYAPVQRSDQDFDPGAKYHISSDTEYIEYFIASIVKFQLYRGLCIAAKQYDPNNPDKKPLHMCDFYRSKEAGARLKAALQVGSSIHWSITLKMITGQSNFDTSAIFDYFRPLIQFLRVENQK